MYKVMIIKTCDEGFWLEEEKDFDSFCLALNYAVNSDFPYEIYRNYYFISALELVARSSYEMWSR